ncbi:MAG: LamG domain-containing protein, partial [Nanoarchaeota archaeon]|nr:LamG domain-containing protein [Nanoarchaeota archaeon]
MKFKKKIKNKNYLFFLVGIGFLFGLILFINAGSESLRVFLSNVGKTSEVPVETNGVVAITNAEHLDENRNFIYDVYNEVKALDDVWSEEIPDNDYVRVVFEQELDSSRDITIYPRIMNGTPKIEIYELNGIELIAEFTDIANEEYNKVYLTGLSGTQDTFDLRVIGGSVEFDHIVDPSEIIFDSNSSNASSGDTNSLSWEHTIGSGMSKILLVGVAHDVGSATLVSNITYGGANFTRLNGSVASTTNGGEMWYLVNPVQGTDTILVTLGSSTKVAAGAQSYFGVNQTTPFSASVADGGTDVSATITIPSASGELVVDSLTKRVLTEAVTPDASQTQRYNIGSSGAGDTDVYAAGSSKPGDTSVDMNWIWGSSRRWVLIAGSLTSTDILKLNYVSPTEESGVIRNRDYIEVNATSELSEGTLDTITINLYNSTGFVQNNSSSSSPFYVNFSNLVNGVYYYNVTANSSLGDEETLGTRTITLDTINLTYVSPTEYSEAVRIRDYIEVNITAEVSIGELDTITINFYNSTQDLLQINTSLSSPFYVNFSNLVNGVYYYNVTANDSLGNEEALETRTITLDTTHPLIDYNTGTSENHANLTQSNIYVNVSVIESVVTNFLFKLYNSTGEVNTTNFTDGTKMYEIGWSSDVIYQYILSTPWNISTAVYDNINISTQDSGPRDLFFKSDGLKLYEIGTYYDKIYQYTCTDAWNLSSCSSDNINISTKDSSGSQGLFFKSDGLKLYEIGSTNNKIYQYTCIDAWNLSSCSYDSINISTQDTSPQGLFFKSDGLKLYEIGSTNSKIYQYTCTDAWNLSSCISDNIDISTQEITPRGLFFKSDGTEMYEVDLEDQFYQYSLSTPWDISTAVFNNENLTTQDNNSQGLFFSLIEPNATRSVNWTNLPDGTYTYNVTIVNGDGNQNTTDTRTITLDTTYPLISYGEGTAVDYANLTQSNIYVNVSVTEVNEVNITFRLYNSTGEVNTTTFTDETRTINWTGLSEGIYTYNVTITDVVNQQNITDTRNINLSFGRAVTLNSPANNNNSVSLTQNIIFNCSANSSVEELKNITLYTNISGVWQAEQTNDLTGTSNSTVFEIDAKSLIGSNTFRDSVFDWNCLVYMLDEDSYWANSNYSFSGWDLGNYTNVTFNFTNNNISLIANSTGEFENMTGSYQSKIFDGLATKSWKNISWDGGPAWKDLEFPNDQVTDSYGANMTGNVLLYHLNNNSAIGENDTNIFDFSGGGNNGTCTFCVFNSSGKYDNAIELNCSTGFVTIPNSASGNLNFSVNGTYTLSAWVYLKGNNSGSSDYQGVITKGDAQYTLQTKPVGGGIYWQFAEKTDGVGWVSLFYPVVYNEWSHLVGVRDGQDINFYVNGILVNNTPAFSGAAVGRDTDYNVRIGSNDYYPQRVFNGTIDEVAVWNRSLTD